jgi:hypothetical protein
MDRLQHLSEIKAAYFRTEILKDHEVEHFPTLYQLKYDDGNFCFTAISFYFEGVLLPLNDVRDIGMAKRE